MLGHSHAHPIGGLVTLFVLSVAVPAHSLQSGVTCLECDEVITRVLPLLPSPAPRITMVDQAPPAPGHSLGKVEAFVLAGERTVYISRRGSIFRHALRGRGVWDYVLAITIWHEMAHLAGANEREAQLREEDLWRQFVVAGKIDRGQGLAYLQLMRKRR